MVELEDADLAVGLGDDKRTIRLEETDFVVAGETEAGLAVSSGKNFSVNTSSVRTETVRRAAEGEERGTWEMNDTGAGKISSLEAVDQQPLLPSSILADLTGSPASFILAWQSTDGGGHKPASNHADHGPALPQGIKLGNQECQS